MTSTTSQKMTASRPEHSQATTRPSHRPHTAIDTADARGLLHRVFGFTDFRPGQLAVIERLLAGKNAL
ncbi:MAG: hypothetical protein JXO22_00695, partial [Phycisphaerae bacterium]|nr:hypothetical protein [Phycisphaerae bacterium]